MKSKRRYAQNTLFVCFTLKRKHFVFRSSHKSKTINNYDMTILHEDELENPHLATVRRRKKTIPSWANSNYLLFLLLFVNICLIFTEDQLQLAIINQVYFQNQNPEEIFGTICIEQVHEIIHSIDNTNKTSVSMISSRHFV